MSYWIAGGTLVLTAAGTASSMYGASQSAKAQSRAAAENARIQKMQAKATAAVQRFQAQLNYKTAMAQVEVFNNNAISLRNQVKTTEQQGFEAVKRLLLAEKQDQSSTRAAYGASGIVNDTGSPLVVEAYNAGMAQLNRMDSAYKTNLDAGALEWEAKLQNYQAELTKETSKQYLYAEQMANWTEKTGVIAANASQMASNSIANASLISGYGNAASNLSSGISNSVQLYSNLRQPTANNNVASSTSTPSTATRAIK